MRNTDCLSLEKSKLIDEIVFGNIDDKYNSIKQHMPEIIYFGCDQFFC